MNLMRIGLPFFAMSKITKRNGFHTSIKWNHMEYTVPEELGGWGKVEKGLQFYGGNDVYYFLGWRRVISSKYNSFPFFSIYLPKVLKQKNQLSLNQSFFKEYFAFCIIITLLYTVLWLDIFFRKGTSKYSDL